MSSPRTFTHMLHPRYRLMDDLMKYRVYPEHLRLRMETVKPIIDDVMVVDWIFNCASVSPNPGSAMRVAFLKLKSKNEKDEVLEVVGGIRDQLEMIQ
ncbi:stress-response A/B barrel domain-containing protein UP3-like protein [Tanacetum coccineum]